MKAISVYALTREQNIHHLQKLERQLSERDYFLKIKEWELNSMKGLVKQLEGHMKEVYALRFFYSFQIPKLGKEFDLLQIKEDQILNLELKSGIVSDEAIRKQLIQNRYYLSVLGRTIRSYTYISSQNRLVRLTNHDHNVLRERGNRSITYILAIMMTDFTPAICLGFATKRSLNDFSEWSDFRRPIQIQHKGRVLFRSDMTLRTTTTLSRSNPKQIEQKLIS